MNEASVVNLVTLLDLLLIGTIFVALPRVGRRGLLFGVYVGESAASSAAARRLIGRWTWTIGGAVVVALAAGLGIAAAVHPVLGNVAALGLVLAAAGTAYVVLHRAARRLAATTVRAEASAAVAPLVAEEPGDLALPLLTVVLTLALGGAAFVYAGHTYPQLPERVPIHFGASGAPDAWAAKSFAAVMSLPLMALVFGPAMGFFAVLTARAKRSVRRDGGASLRAQTRFRAAVVRMLCGTAVLTTVLLAWIGIQGQRVALGRADSLGPGVWWITGLLLVFTLGYLVRLFVVYGQGGARAEGEASAPLTNGLADDQRWVMGIFYVNRDDPSILVEKRFGIGYTINFGNPKAVALLVGFLGLLGVLIWLSKSAAGR